MRVVAVAIWLVVGTSFCTSRAIADRTSDGLLVLYDFASDSGPAVKDRSGVGKPLDLRIDDVSVARRSAGTLEVRGKTLIRSTQPAGKVLEAVQRTGEITIEAWLRPANLKQDGPARVVTLSSSPNERNFTLGQEADRFQTRFRTSKTSKNGIPSLDAPRRSVSTKLQHVVYTRARGGKAKLFVDGKLRKEQASGGKINNWDSRFHLGLANEADGSRPWLGTFHLVAIYSRALSRDEVGKNFRAGAAPQMDADELASIKRKQTFERQVAPLLAKHCLECHEPASMKGDLDLSRQKSLLAGGESGPAIVPGKSGESLLWELVEADEMPMERDALTSTDKEVLRQWIDDGAEWSLAVIDPAIYAHEGTSGENWVQRLTVPEYIETVRAAVGVDIAKEARNLLPPDLQADGFSNTAYNLNVDLKHVGAYSQLAETIVARMDVLKFGSRFSKSRSLSTDATMRDFVEAMGKRLLRGPLNDREITNYSGIATTVASAGGNYEEAVTYILEAMLQSPRFIYRIESHRGDGQPWPVTDHELASRLSYIIWGGPPDEQLFQAADKGQLDRAGVQRQVKRMLDDPRAVSRSKQFLIEWLNLNRLANLQPNAERFPDWDPQLAGDMRDETLSFFEEVVWTQQRPLADLLNAQVTLATPRLARHYGFGDDAAEQTATRYDLSQVKGRGGLLTQGSVLTVGGDEASMVTRGLFVLHNLLRGIVKDPPPCVDTRPVATKPGLTQRAIAEGRIANVACGGCHAKFEPLAYGLERFDGLGTYHERDEHDNLLRDDGEVLFPGTGEPMKYESAGALMDMLAESPRVRESLTWKVTQFALGRPLAAEDAAEVAKIHQASQDGGGTYDSLITAIVTSDLVRMTRTERDE